MRIKIRILPAAIVNWILSLIEPRSLDDGNLDFDGCEQGNDNPLLEDGHTLSDNFLTTTHDANIPIIEEDDIGLYQGCQCNDVPTTNADDTVLAIEEETAYGGSFRNIKISGHVLLNQCGTLLTRNKHQIKSSSRHSFFLQKLVARSEGSAIPLMYPEGVLFPSIHWKIASDGVSILGCLPAPLLTESQKTGFATILIKCTVAHGNNVLCHYYVKWAPEM